jgi:hypothetical protein
MFSRLAFINRIILSAGDGTGYNVKENPFDIDVNSASAGNLLSKQIITNLALHLSANGLIVVTLPDFNTVKALEYMNNKGDANTDWAIEIIRNRSCSHNPSLTHKRIGIFYHPISKENKEIAQMLTTDLINNGANTTSGIKPDTESLQGTLAWIRKPKMLSHIIEADFSDEPIDEELVDFYARSIAKSICKALGLNFISDILRA